ncbi:MAG: hypothetical protein JEZ08_21040 [Clostridiales bacterium]|nr:hypothetical protein [Clostridiales bacterium]
MNKRNLLIGLVTGALLLTGCGDADELITNKQKNVTINATSEATDETVSTNNNTYETVGEVISIHDGSVSILTGDIMEDFKVSNVNINEIYLGQIVSVTKETDTDYSLMPYIIDDFSVRHTNMGNIIDRVDGEVLRIEEGNLIIQLKDGSELSASTGDENLIAYIADALNHSDNLTLEFDIVTFSKDSSYVLATYNQESKLSLIIDQLNRLDSGELEILASDNAGGQFVVGTKNPIKNFNLTDLTVGQSIDVYAEMIMESFPAQVKALRIDLLEDTPTGVTSLEYDVIGEVIEITGNEVHILSGDIVEIFDIDKEQLKTVYLGQTVKLFSKEGLLILEPYIIEDFSIRHTNMGQTINEFNGTVISIESKDNENFITIESDDQEMVVNYYGDILPQIDTFYEFESISFVPGEMMLSNFYNPESIITVTVTALDRADNGELMLLGTDKDGGEYHIGTSSPTVNFNLSELSVGDVLNVYADAVMESFPMQVQTTKIIKVTER